MGNSHSEDIKSRKSLESSPYILEPGQKPSIGYGRTPVSSGMEIHSQGHSSNRNESTMREGKQPMPSGSPIGSPIASTTSTISNTAKAEIPSMASNTPISPMVSHIKSFDIKETNPYSVSNSSCVKVTFPHHQPFVSIPLQPMITFSIPYPCLFRWIRLVPKNTIKSKHSIMELSHLRHSKDVRDARDITNKFDRDNYKHKNNSKDKNDQDKNSERVSEFVVSHSSIYTPTLEDEGHALLFQCIVIKDARGEGVQVKFKKTKNLPHVVARREWIDRYQAKGLNFTSTLHEDQSKSYASYSRMDARFRNTIDRTFTVAVYNMMGKPWCVQENEMIELTKFQQNSKSTSAARKDYKAKFIDFQRRLRLEEKNIANLRQQFSKCPGYIFSHGYRKKMALREMLSYHADLYFLQSVNLEEYKYWNIELSKLGYSSSISDHKDVAEQHLGICIMYRRSKFNRSEQTFVKFSDINRLQGDDVDVWRNILPSIRELCAHYQIDMRYLYFGGRMAIIHEFDLRDLYLMRSNLTEDTDEKLLVANLEVFIPQNKPKEYQDAVQIIQIYVVMKMLHHIWKTKYNGRRNISFIIACDLGTTMDSLTYKFITQSFQPSANTQRDTKIQTSSNDSFIAEFEHAIPRSPNEQLFQHDLYQNSRSQTVTVTPKTQETPSAPNGDSVDTRQTFIEDSTKNTTSKQSMLMEDFPLIQSPFEAPFTSAYHGILGTEPEFLQSTQIEKYIGTTSFIFVNNLSVRRISSVPSNTSFPNLWSISNHCCLLSDVEFPTFEAREEVDM